MICPMNHSVFLFDYYNCLIPALRHFYAKGRNYRSMCFAAIFPQNALYKISDGRVYFLNSQCIKLINEALFYHRSSYRIIKRKCNFLDSQRIKLTKNRLFLQEHCVFLLNTVSFSQLAFYKIIKGSSFSKRTVKNVIVLGYFLNQQCMKSIKKRPFSKSALHKIFKWRGYFASSQCIE